jgi:diaminohydroxyphosphoribosylaminopyrimidine deaminase/5-amino-6-(5-phosphoribosylamino)uracil reductase
MVLDDAKWMEIALRLADRNTGNVCPNPSVGCLIVKGDIIVGRGWTQAGGRPHAEVMALEQAGEKSIGATVYTTLEPCSHYGETPPCSHALISARIKRLVGAMKDPDPRVDGKGYSKLRDAGIEVSEGVLEREATELNRGFIARVTKKIPFVTLKMAMSIDSRIATKTGDSKWITCEKARYSSHFLRSKHDAILTGIGTVLSDNPILNTRISGLENRSPTRIIMDTKLRLPVDSQIVATATECKTIIFTTSAAEKSKKKHIESFGLQVVTLTGNKSGRVSLIETLEFLAAKGINSVLVEGGGILSTEFLRSDLIDELLVYRAPIVLGGDGRAAVEGLGVSDLSAAAAFERTGIASIGTDLMETYKRGK